MYYYVKTEDDFFVLKTNQKKMLNKIDSILQKEGFGTCKSCVEISKEISKNNFQDYLLSCVKEFAEKIGYKHNFVSSDVAYGHFYDFEGDKEFKGETTVFETQFSLDEVVFLISVEIQLDFVFFTIGYQEEDGTGEYLEFDPLDKEDTFDAFEEIVKKHLSEKVAVYDPAVRFAYSEEGQNVLKKALEIKAKEGEDAFLEFLGSDELPQYSHILVCENEGKFDKKEFDSFQFDNGLKRVCFSFGSKEYSGCVFEADDLDWQANNNSPEASALPHLVDPNDIDECTFIVYLDPTQDTFEEMRTFFNKLARLDLKSSELYEKVAIYDFECRRVGSIWFE